MQEQEPFLLSGASDNKVFMSEKLFINNDMKNYLLSSCHIFGLFPSETPQ
jgi:hypothetical protein